MNRTLPVALIIFLFMAAILPKTYAADTTTASRYPSAILVQLSAEKNRIEHLTQKHEHALLDELLKDAVAVQNITIADFQDHIKSRPVYYYMDTNLTLVKKGQLDGILMNADRTPANVHFTDTNYIIVFYGFPVGQSHKGSTKPIVADSSYQYSNGEVAGEGLIINNYKLQQIAYFLMFGLRRIRFELHSVAKQDRTYAYKSKHFDIEYYPFARMLEEKITQQ